MSSEAKTTRLIVSLLVWLTISVSASAAVPSCYAANPSLGVSSPSPRTEVFVIIDQTTMLDSDLQREVMQAIDPLVAQGNAFWIGRFSAFAQGRYMSSVDEGKIELPPPDNVRFHTSKPVMQTFDRCLHDQLIFARHAAAFAITNIIAQSSPTLGHSDVMASMRSLSEIVRESRALDRVVLIVSDMLENSSISSFYAHGGLRRLNPATELQRASAAGLLGDFRGARIYVIGAGMLPADAKEADRYRDVIAIRALQDFWTQYFIRSHGRVAGFGKPALLAPVR